MTASEAQAQAQAQAEFDIARLGRHGDGIDAAGAIFAPLTLPGERVAGTPDAAGRVEAPRILAPSPDRVAPACPHFGACGGCALLHASDAFVAGWKRERIVTALAARGLEAEVTPTITSPMAARRRATLSAKRTRTGATIGFHARREARIVEIPECRVLDPAIPAGFDALRRVAAEGGSRKGEMKMTVAVTEGGLDVDVTGGKPLDGPARLRLAAVAGETGLARLAWEGETISAPHTPALVFGPARVVPPPGAFLQATREGEAALLAAAREAVGDAGRIADLFAGLGTFALPLAEAAEVTAWEGEAAMVGSLLAGWRGTGGRLKRVEAFSRDLFRKALTAGELKGFDAAVIDPPRAGAAAQSEALAASAVPRIAAISCNPETFARDARILVDGGYVLDWVRPVDQFRGAAHVELAAAFRRP